MIITKIVLAACALSATAAGVNQLWEQVPPAVAVATTQPPLPQQVPPPAIDMSQLAGAFRR